MKLLINDRWKNMPWDAVDAVVFDVGNVLLAFDPASLAARVFPDEPEKSSVILDRVTGTPYWTMLDHGTLSLEEAETAMSAGDESLRPAIRRFLHGWQDLPPIPEGIRTLESVKAHGKKAFVLSNYHDSSFAWVQERRAFFGLVDGFLVSSRVGLLKPDPDIYRLAEARFGLTTERTLFIDDSPLNVEAALHAGWQGFWFRRPGQLDAFFGN